MRELSKRDKKSNKGLNPSRQENIQGKLATFERMDIQVINKLETLGVFQNYLRSPILSPSNN